eukprot:30248-Pelagococcus_subviridis.AAC.3
MRHELEPREREPGDAQRLQREQRGRERGENLRMSGVQRAVRGVHLHHEAAQRAEVRTRVERRAAFVRVSHRRPRDGDERSPEKRQPRRDRLGRAAAQERDEADVRVDGDERQRGRGPGRGRPRADLRAEAVRHRELDEDAKEPVLRVLVQETALREVRQERRRRRVAGGKVLHPRPLVEVLRDGLAETDRIRELFRFPAAAAALLLFALRARLLDELGDVLRRPRARARLRERVQGGGQLRGGDARLDDDAVLHDVHRALHRGRRAGAAAEDELREVRVELAQKLFAHDARADEAFGDVLVQLPLVVGVDEPPGDFARDRARALAQRRERGDVRRPVQTATGGARAVVQTLEQLLRHRQVGFIGLRRPRGRARDGGRGGDVVHRVPRLVVLG